MTIAVLASRRFETTDQQRFAAVSGDRNPMHMDPAYARRTQAGAAVVHGVHAVAWALDMLARQDALPPLPFRLRVAFKSFLFVGDEALLVPRLDKRGEPVGFALETGGQMFAQIDLLPPAEAMPAAGARAAIVSALPREGRLALAGDPAALDLDGLTRAIGDAAVAELVLLSTLVGMECPGLLSIFSSFDVTISGGDGEAAFAWALLDHDNRFARVALAVRGRALSGQAVALERKPPVAGRDMASVRGLVGAGEFADMRALVIGGSRGLGAATAKLVVAGGGRATITYREGREEAEALAADIGGERIVATAFAVGDDPDRAFAGLGSFTHLFYFATPKIFGMSRGAFDAAAFRGFSDVYVDRLWPLIDWHVRTSDAPRPFVFAPSSVAVVDRPRGMTEYAMAKAAMEVMGADLARVLPVDISMPRLPRIETDQTATVPPVPAADAVDIMLACLRGEPV